MNDAQAKQIIRAYEMGDVSLSEYVEAIEHVAEFHPDMSMEDLSDWTHEDIDEDEASFSEEDYGEYF